MVETLTLIASIVLGFLVLFQLALILGAPLGKFAWGGAHEVLPTGLKIGSGVSIIVYVICIALIVDKGSLINTINNNGIVSAGVWVFTVYFFVGVALNGISRSKRERVLMTPVALALALLFLGVALG